MNLALVFGCWLAITTLLLWAGSSSHRDTDGTPADRANSSRT